MPTWANELARDVRYALRCLRAAPILSVTIIVTLALGVGANAAVLSLADRLLLRSPRGVAHPSELRRIYTRSNWSVGAITEIHTEIGYPQFEAVAASAVGHARFTAYTKPDSIVVGSDDVRSTVHGSYVDAAFFPLLGVRLERGRPFSAEEDRLGTPTSVAIISDSYWKHHFNGDPHIIGVRAQFDHQTYTIIGVADAGFRGPDLQGTDVWLSLSSIASDPGNPWYQSWRSVRQVRAIARIVPGASDASLSAAATAAFRRGELEHVTRGPDTATVLVGPIVETLGPSIGERPDVAITTRLIGVALAVLLVACANAANLLLARAVSRRREIAVRLALGVSRTRLMGQLLAGSVALAVIAGLVACVVGLWSAGALARIVLPDTTLAGDSLDWRMIAATLTIAIIVGVLGGLAPALYAWRSDVVSGLKAGGRDTAVGTVRARPLLVVAQTALSLVLIVGAGLFARSSRDVEAIDVGYDVDRLVFGTVLFYDRQRHDLDYFGETHAAETDAGIREAAARLARTPGIERVAQSDEPPMEGYGMIRLSTSAGPVPRLDNRDPALLSTSPSYFATTGVELRRGRLFADNDGVGSPLVVVVNETAARTFWPNSDALGQCLHVFWPQAPCSRVIGVIKDSHLQKVIESHTAEVFVPAAQQRGIAARAMYLVVRAAPRQTTRAAETMRRTLRSIFPDAEPPYVRTVASAIEPQLRPWRLGTVLLTAFGALALIVAAIGVYSAMAYSVTERTRELGIRVAIGASATRILRLVIGGGTRTVFVGVLAGVALALAGGRLVASMLYATSPHDPLVISGASAMLIMVAVIASAVSAWRASRADPMIALRAD